MFLVDVASENIDRVSGMLTRNLSDFGVQWQRAAARLESFNAVQNTYLSTFQLLGGLGLIVGCFGLGAVVLRNVFERQGELASLAAFGFSRLEIVRMVALEHVGLLLAGMIIAACSAAMAVFPSWLGRGDFQFPKSLVYTLFGVMANGIVWAWMTALVAVKKHPAEALRDA
jgi:ABC-type antimicrobial peptide transport system permease subunit